MSLFTWCEWGLILGFTAVEALYTKIPIIQWVENGDVHLIQVLWYKFLHGYPSSKPNNIKGKISLIIPDFSSVLQSCS